MSNTDTSRMLGYKNFKSYIELASFGDKAALVEGLFDTCHRWEIARYLFPQGPLKLEALDEELLSRWKSDIDAGTATISDCLEQLCGSAECPVPQTKEFWQKYRGISRQTGSGSEDAFDKLGSLVYRATLSRTPNKEVKITLAPAVIGASRRLWRGYPSRRLIRIHVPEDLYRELACLEAVLGDQPKPYRRNFDATMSKEIHIMGARFRLHYSKPGSQSFILWAEQSARPEDPFISLMDFCNELIPLCHPYNQSLSLAKYAARLSLWLSQTIPISLDAKIQVRWVPDLTNKTLGITYAGMESLSKAFGLDYVPTCITGTIGDGQKAIRYTWSRYHHRKRRKQSKKTICLFNDLLDYQSEWVEIEFRLHYDGAKRTEKRLKQTFEQEDVDYTVEQPHYPEEIMTDGCAIMSFKLARAVQQAKGMTHVPCAVQARLAGCKGVWTLDVVPDTKDPVPWIEVRDSQHKCAVDERWFTFEILRTESVSKGVNLGEQTATVLRQAQPETRARNAIDRRLAELELNELEHLEQMFDFERSDPTMLRTYLEKRMSYPLEATSNSQESQAQKCSTHNYGDVEEDDADLDGVESGCRPNPSGYPATSEERCIAMIDAGYSLDDAMFRQELQVIQASVTKSHGKTRIPVEKARHLSVVADQWDCLSRPDELFCQLSDLPVDPETNLRGSNVLEGPVLINRNPCVQDSDIQKCTAVDVRSLKHFRDLVIVPAIGARSVLSKLSSGDYDGDTVNITWDQQLTEPWSNTSEHVDPPFESDVFFKKAEYTMGQAITQVKELVSMYRQLDELTEEHVRFLQRIMCGPGLLPPAYGRLSALHTELTTLADVGNPFVSAVGHLYTSALDAAKAGTWFRLAHLNFDALWDRLSIELDHMGIKPYKKVTADVVADSNRKRSREEGAYMNGLALQIETGQMPMRGKKNSKHTLLDMKNDISAGSPIRASTSHQSLISFSVTKANSLVPIEDATLSRSKSAPEALALRAERQAPIVAGQFIGLSLYDQDFLSIWPGAAEHYPGSRFLQSCAEKALEKYIGYIANIGRSTQYYREARRRISARARLAPELLKIFEGFWKDASEAIQRHPPSAMPGPYLGWKHIVAAATYYVASRSKASDYVRTTFPAVFCWQWLLDIKAEAVESRTKGTSEGARRIPSERLAELKGRSRRILAPALPALPTVTNTVSHLSAEAMTAPGSEQADPCSPAKCRKGEHAVSTPWTPRKKVARNLEFDSPGSASEASPSKKKTVAYSDDEMSDFGDSLGATTREEWEELEELSELKLFQAKMDDSGIGKMQSSQE